MLYSDPFPALRCIDWHVEMFQKRVRWSLLRLLLHRSSKTKFLCSLTQVILKCGFQAFPGPRTVSSLSSASQDVVRNDELAWPRMIHLALFVKVVSSGCKIWHLVLRLLLLFDMMSPNSEVFALGLKGLLSFRVTLLWSVLIHCRVLLMGQIQGRETNLKKNSFWQDCYRETIK